MTKRKMTTAAAAEQQLDVATVARGHFSDGMDVVKLTKWFLTLTLLTGGCGIVLAAQDAGGSVLSPQTWTPQTFFTAAAMIFAFGTGWQTLRFHTKILREITDWKANRVEPTLNEHGTDIALLMQSFGNDSHRKRGRGKIGG